MDPLMAHVVHRRMKDSDQRQSIEVPEGRDWADVCNHIAKTLHPNRPFETALDEPAGAPYNSRHSSAAASAAAPKPNHRREAARPTQAASLHAEGLPLPLPGGVADAPLSTEARADRTSGIRPSSGVEENGQPKPVKGADDTVAHARPDSVAADEREGRVQDSTSVTTSPARRGIRDTSMIAYRALQYSGTLAQQEKAIVDHFLKDPAQSWTRQELARDIIWQGRPMPINAVCGRVNALMQPPFELLIELPDKKRCSVTGNNVNALALTPA